MDTVLQQRARQSEAIARDSLAHQSNEQLANAWQASNEAPTTRALTILRGWMLDELESRMDALDAQEARSPLYLGQRLARFERWLEAECAAPKGAFVSPAGYLI